MYLWLLDNAIVKKEVETMIKEIKVEYEKWCKEKELIPYPKEYCSVCYYTDPF